MKYANIINKKMQLVWNSILMGVKKKRCPNYGQRGE